MKIKLAIFLIFCLGFACKFSPSEVNANGSDTLLDQIVISTILPGAERVGLYHKLLENKNIAIVVNQASRVSDEHLLDTLLSLEINIVKIFAPEHGFRGKADAGEHVDHEIDPKTGIPIVSLYGNNRKPSNEQMRGIDYVVFDLQDVGVRFYTYISTLHYVMEACASNKIPLLILDRPNPNGFYVDGEVLDTNFQSFVGMHPVPVVYGMTIGEYGMMINGESWLPNELFCQLKVIECLNYNHKMTYELPIPPSPNLPNLRSILLYPSLCFLEPTIMSIGRGTENQFQVIGNPEWKGQTYSFTPISRNGAKHPKHENTICHGIDLTSVGKYDLLNKSTINLEYLMRAFNTLNDKKFISSPSFFDKLAGSSALRNHLNNGSTEEKIRRSWEPQLSKFKLLRKKYLLYKDFN